MLEIFEILNEPYSKLLNCVVGVVFLIFEDGKKFSWISASEFSKLALINSP